MSQEELRKRVRLLKAQQCIPYKVLSELLEIKKSSMYNWLRNQYELSEKRAQRLEEILQDLED